MPPSHGESGGPKIDAPHTNKESSERGLALQPAGGCDLTAFKSDMSRNWAELVDDMSIGCRQGSEKPVKVTSQTVKIRKSLVTRWGLEVHAGKTYGI